MLTKLILENFKSFNKRTEIDFKKTNYTILPQNIAENGCLKGAVFVGANASGKSNVLLGIKLFLELLFREKDIDFSPYVSLIEQKNFFKLEYHFLIEGEKISYAFSWDGSKNFLSEKLIVDQKVMLDRQGLSATTYIDEEIHYDDNDVPSGKLFLRTLYFNTKFASSPILQKLMEFLTSSIYLDQADYKYTANMKFSLPNYLKEHGADAINAFFSKNNFKQQVTYTNESRQLSSMNPIPIPHEELILTREDAGYSLPFKYESTGTKALIEALPLFFHATSKPCMLIIDEFSNSFHNELEELLVKFFMKSASQSQLFIVTHSTNLLSNSLLRPDQEFAVEFKGAEGSSIKRFSSEQPRIAQNIEKMYESGVFGGLPNYTEVAFHENS